MARASFRDLACAESTEPRAALHRSNDAWTVSAWLVARAGGPARLRDDVGALVRARHDDLARDLEGLVAGAPDDVAVVDLGGAGREHRVDRAVLQRRQLDRAADSRLVDDRPDDVVGHRDRGKDLRV